MILFNSKEVRPVINGQNLSRVLYNGKQIYPKLSTEIALSDTKAGDVLLWDKVNGRKLFAASDKLSNYPADSYTPIGVVVIPASHTTDGTARIMSLAAMDYNNPDNGNTTGDIGMAWGGYKSDIATLPNLTKSPYIGSAPDSISSPQQLVGWTSCSRSYICSDYYLDTSGCYNNPFDSKAAWGSETEGEFPLPSPYLEDSSKNEIYHSIADTGNAYADMDGKGNTEKILVIDNLVSTDWQTAATIINNTNLSTNTQPHTAAQCCWRFHTVGTNQGDWYLPSAGELGYLGSRWKVINASISKVSSFGFGALSLPVNNTWLSSSEYSSQSEVGLYFSSTYASLGNRIKSYDYYYVRAFLKVSPFDLIQGFDPDEAANGIYVYANNGKLYEPSSWDTALNNSALGVAVVTDNCRFAISKELPMVNNVQWSSALCETDIDGILTTSSQNTAITDYAGQNNTKLIRNAASGEDSSNNAAHYCYAQTLNEEHGYLPAAGELAVMYNNKSDINEALQKK